MYNKKCIWEEFTLTVNIMLELDMLSNNADWWRRRQFPKSTHFYLVTANVVELNQISSCEAIEISVKAASFSQ